MGLRWHPTERAPADVRTRLIPSKTERDASFGAVYFGGALWAFRGGCVLQLVAFWRDAAQQLHMHHDYGECPRHRDAGLYGQIECGTDCRTDINMTSGGSSREAKVTIERRKQPGGLTRSLPTQTHDEDSPVVLRMVTYSLLASFGIGLLAWRNPSEVAGAGPVRLGRGRERADSIRI